MAIIDPTTELTGEQQMASRLTGVPLPADTSIIPQGEPSEPEYTDPLTGKFEFPSRPDLLDKFAASMETDSIVGALVAQAWMSGKLQEIGKEKLDNSPEAVERGMNDPSYHAAGTETALGKQMRMGITSQFTQPSENYLGESSTEKPWNPYELLSEGFVNEHPYMVKYFENGFVNDLPNETAFWRFVARQKEDNEARQARSGSFGGQVLESIPGQIADASAIALLPPAAITKWLKSGGTVKRVGKAMLTGAAANEAQELSLTAINPRRNVDEVQANAIAILSGAALAGAVPLMISTGKFGVRRTANLLTPTSDIVRLQKTVTNAMVDPENFAKFTEARHAAESSNSVLDDLLAEEVPPDFVLSRPAGSMLPEATADLIPNVGPQRSVAVLETADNAAKIAEVKKKWGDKVAFMRHPQQDTFDYMTQLDSLDKSLSKYQAAPLTGTVGKAADALNAVSGKVGFAAGEKLRHSPMESARQMLRLIADDAFPTVESAKTPLSSTVQMPAEQHLWNMDVTKLQAEGKAADAWLEFRKSGDTITHRLPNGETLTISNRYERSRFNRVVQDYIYQVAELANGHRQAVEFHPTVKKAGDALLEYYAAMGVNLRDTGLLGKMRANYGGSQRWDTALIRMRHNEFVDKLYKQFQRNHEVDFKTAKALTPEERAVIVNAVSGKVKAVTDGLLKTERAALRRAIKAAAKAAPDKPFTEVDALGILGKDGMLRYRNDVNAYLRRGAEHAWRSITKADNIHGVDIGMSNGSVLKDRVLEVLPTEMYDFLEHDAMNNLTRYHHQTAGRAALRRSIKENEAYWGPMVKELTGKDLAESGHDPMLILDAVKADAQRWSDLAAKVGDKKTVEAVERAVRTAVGDGKRAGLIASKLDELTGTGGYATADNFGPAFKFAERNIPRVVSMAMLGKIAVNSIPDMAGYAMHSKLTPRLVGKMARTINIAKKVPVRNLEGLYAAITDDIANTRMRAIADIVDIEDNVSYGIGAKGRTLAKADKGVEIGTKAFFRLTGMGRWNTNAKRTAINLIMPDIIHAAKKMAQAEDLRLAGMPELEAIAKVGLDPRDATRMSRLGFNGARSRELVQTVFDYGVDIKGNRPWTTLSDFLADEHAVMPQMADWMNLKPELYDRFRGAVNSEAMNTVVEPKLMTRPLMNNHIVGRLFNQFQAFSNAWTQQFLPSLAQHPTSRQAVYTAAAIPLGAMAAAVSNSLSGRRDFDETAKLWQEAPLGMVYEAIDRSGMLGNLSRPMGWIERTPIGGPAKWSGVNTTAMQGAQIQGLLGVMGPSWDYTDRAWRATQAMVNDPTNPRTHKMLWRMMPGRNLVEVEAAYKAAEYAGIVDEE